VPNTKVVTNIQIYLYPKFHIFLRFLIISFPFISLLLGKSNWKRNLKLKKDLGPLRPRRPTITAPSSPIPRMRWPVTASCSTVTAGWPHLLGPSSPKSPLPRTHWRRRRDSSRCAELSPSSSCHDIAHLCTYLLEPSHPASCHRVVAPLRCHLCLTAPPLRHRCTAMMPMPSLSVPKFS
jgi:hypothetical protein